MIFSLKIKLNRSFKILEELECAFDVVGKILMGRILWNLFGKIWIRKKPGFGRKNQLRMTW
jgi:hypothetical protein